MDLATVLRRLLQIREDFNPPRCRDLQNHQHPWVQFGKPPNRRHETDKNS